MPAMFIYRRAGMAGQRIRLLNMSPGGAMIGHDASLRTAPGADCVYTISIRPIGLW